MEKKKINKLVVPLTLRSVSLLGAFTVMTTSIAGCSNKDKDNIQEATSVTSMTSSSAEDVTNSIDSIISEDISQTTTSLAPSSSEDEVTSEVTTATDSIISTTSKVENSSTTTSKADKNNSSKVTSKADKNNSSKTTSKVESDSSSKDDNKKDNSSVEDKFIPLTPDNINDVSLFKKAVCEVAKDTRGNFGGIWTYEYNDKLYKSFGLPYDEFMYILVSFNRNDLTDETISALLEPYSLDDMNKFINILNPMFTAINDEQKVNNWKGLIVDKEILTKIETIEKGYLECRYNGDVTLLKELVMNYDNSNPIIGFYLILACDIATDYRKVDDVVFIDRFLDIDFKLGNECSNFATEMYNISHGKSKVLE